MTDQADIGLIGLAVMGRNLVLNMADNGYRVAVYNRTYERTESLLAGAGPLADRLIGCQTLDQLVEAIRPPRPVVLMVKAGPPVDEQIAALRPLMADGRHHHGLRQRQLSRHGAPLRRAGDPAASSTWAPASPAARKAPATGRRSWQAARRRATPGSRRS